MLIPLELQIILYSAINILSLYTLYSALNILYKPKKHIFKFTKYILFVFYLLGGIATYWWDNLSYFNIIIQIVLVVIVSLNFVTSTTDKFIVACLWPCFRLIVELFIGLSLQLGFGIFIRELVSNDLFKIVGSIICQFIILTFIKAVQLIRLHKKTSESILSETSLQICITPLCSIIILISYTQISFQDSLNEYITILSLSLIVLMNVFFFYLFDKLKSAEKLKYENQLLKNQSEYFYLLEQNINDTFEKVRTLKHDMKHHLLYLKSKTEDSTEQSLSEIKESLDTLIQESLVSDFVEYTQNKKLNRLLNYKLGLINQSDIDIDIKVNIPQYVHIDESSLYVILGNGIDNAIANFDSSKSKNKSINIRIMDDDGNLYIRISNPFAKKLQFKNGLPVTDKSDKTLHGLGLKSIKEIVESKRGAFKILTSNHEFVLEILLYNEMT